MWIKKLGFSLLACAALSIQTQTVSANAAQLCGSGTVEDLYAGGWNNGEIYLKIDPTVSTPPNYFSEPLKVLRISPSLTDQHKNRIYSTLLLAIANKNVVEFRSMTQNASGIADCRYIAQVMIRSNN